MKYSIEIEGIERKGETERERSVEVLKNDVQLGALRNLVNMKGELDNCYL